MAFALQQAGGRARLAIVPAERRAWSRINAARGPNKRGALTESEVQAKISLLQVPLLAGENEKQSSDDRMLNGGARVRFQLRQTFIVWNNPPAPPQIQEPLMSLTRRLALALFSAGLLSACSKEAEQATSSTTGAVAPGITGVPECDQFLAAYEQCLMDKIPAEARAQMGSGIEQWKTAWKSMADNPGTRSALPAACAQARDASAPALKAYGCAL